MPSPRASRRPQIPSAILLAVALTVGLAAMRAAGGRPPPPRSSPEAISAHHRDRMSLS